MIEDKMQDASWLDWAEPCKDCTDCAKAQEFMAGVPEHKGGSFRIFARRNQAENAAIAAKGLDHAQAQALAELAKARGYVSVIEAE